MAKIRLDKFITLCGTYTRSQAKKLIHSKKVTVNDNIITDEGFKVDEDDKNVKISGIPCISEKYIYIMLNKPVGVISATEDKRHKTVIDLLSDDDKRNGLFPVGRLDIDTEGLLILTNDGNFAHNTLSPKKHVSKLYAADVASYKYTEESKDRFLNGISLSDGYLCKPAHLSLISKTDDISSVTLEITEGKFHQVKKMFEAEGRKVIKLKRLSFGDIMLDPALKSGEYRRLNEKEMEYIKFINGDKE